MTHPWDDSSSQLPSPWMQGTGLTASMAMLTCGVVIGAVIGSFFGALVVSGRLASPTPSREDDSTVYRAMA